MPNDTVANSSRLCTARDRLCQSLKPPYSSITAGRQRIRRADGRSVCTASTSRRAEQAHEQQPREPSIDRRLSLVALAGAAVLCSRPADAAGSADEATYASDAGSGRTWCHSRVHQDTGLHGKRPPVVLSLSQSRAHLQPLLSGLHRKSVHAAPGSHLPAGRQIQRHALTPQQECIMCVLPIEPSVWCDCKLSHIDSGLIMISVQCRKATALSSGHHQWRLSDCCVQLPVLRSAPGLLGVHCRAA